MTAGNDSTDFRAREPVLSGDLLAMTDQYRTWADEALDVRSLPMLLRRAFRVALMPPTGPVFLGLPLDVMHGETDAEPERLGPIPTAHRGDPDQVERAAELLVEVDRSALVVVDHVARSGPAAVVAAVNLAEAAGLRVHGESLACEVDFPTDHDQWVSYIPPDETVARTLMTADTLVLAGCSTNTTFTGHEGEFVDRETTAIRLGDDAWEVGKVEPAGAYVVDEGVTSKYAMLTRWPPEPKQSVSNKGGGLGYGPPAAIGAAMAESMRPEPRVVVGYVGDGSYLYYPNALYTAARYRVDLAVVVPDNRNYRILKDDAIALFGGDEADHDLLGMDLDPPVDIPKNAESHGATGRLVEAPAASRQRWPTPSRRTGRSSSTEPGRVYGRTRRTIRHGPIRTRSRWGARAVKTRDVSLPVASQSSLDDYADLARRAETLGYGRVWLPETWGRDAVTVLAAVAERTGTVGIGTSVLPVYSRSPALLGQTAATLQELSGGRFRLGLGPSGPVVVEGWHGASFEAPLRRTRETVEVVRAVLSGEEVRYRGERFDLAGFRLRCDAPHPPPAVDAAGMGPKAVELAGRFADGWHGLMLTPDGVTERLRDFDRGAELGDRDRADQRVTIAVGCCALDDADRARRLARSHVAFYVGAMGTFYRDALARQGHDEVAHDVAAKWGSGEREAAMAAIPDDLLDELGAAGTPDRARRLLERFEAIDGVDSVSVAYPRGATLAEMYETMAALAP